MGFWNKVSKKNSLPPVSEMKNLLYEKRKELLMKQYPNHDDWRRPENIGESMMCVGYAMSLLEVYRRQLDQKPEDEIVVLYKEEFNQCEQKIRFIRSSGLKK